MDLSNDPLWFRLNAAGANHAFISFAITMRHSAPICRNSRSWEKSNDGQGTHGHRGKSTARSNDNSAYPKLGATGNPLCPHCTQRGVPFGDCVTLRPLWQERRLRKLRQLRPLYGGGELVHASLHHPVSGLG